VHDRIHEASTSQNGIDLRCVGGLVEDCTSINSTRNSIINSNVGAPVLKPEWDSWARRYTKKFVRVSAPFQGIRAPNESGLTIFEDCDIGHLAASLYANSDCKVIVDERTRVRSREVNGVRTSFASDILDHTVMRGARALVPKTQMYASYYNSCPINSAVQSNPCQITTLWDHKLRTGDSVTFSGVGGMTELNSGDYSVTVVDATTFTLDGTDATAFGVYTSGGSFTTTGVRPTATGISQSNPVVVTIPDASTFQVGDVVWFDGETGMTELNGDFYKIGSVSGNDVTLTDMDDNDIDATGYSAAVGDGKLCRQMVVDCVNAADSPQAGLGDGLKTITYLRRGVSGSSRYWRWRLAFRTIPGFGLPTQDYMYGVIRAWAGTRVGFAKTERQIGGRVPGFMTIESAERIENWDAGSATLTFRNFRDHFKNELDIEGTDWNSASGKRRLYTLVDVFLDVGTPSSPFVYDVAFEIDMRHAQAHLV